MDCKVLQLSSAIKENMMKKTIYILILILVLPLLSSAISLEPGFMGGLRQINSNDIKTTYGNGMVFYPHLDVRLFMGLSIGAGYEFGYSKEGQIGDFQDNSSFEIKGYDLYLTYSFSLFGIKPYIKAGYGNYTYNQVITINQETLNTDGTHKDWMAAFGIKVFPMSNLFLSAEIKYSPMKVRPYDIDVDLGGIKIFAGIGYRFKL